MNESGAHFDRQTGVNPKSIRIYKEVRVIDSDLKDDISIGDYSIIRKSVLMDRVEIGRRNTIDYTYIDKNTYTGEFCIIKHCHIGKYCAISWNVSIGGANHELNHISVTPVSRIFDTEKLYYRSFDEEDVVIGNDVWIAAGAHILRGVTIGNGAVIAANAVVTHDVEPYSIVGGIPAKRIGQRFESYVVDRLQKIKWWDWSDKQFEKAHSFFNLPLEPRILDHLEEICNME